MQETTIPAATWLFPSCCPGRGWKPLLQSFSGGYSQEVTWCLNGKSSFGAARRLRAGNFAIQREILRNTGLPPDIVRAGRVRIRPEKPNPMNEGFISCFLLENARPNHAFGVISGGFRQVPAASQNSLPFVHFVRMTLYCRRCPVFASLPLCHQERMLRSAHCFLGIGNWAESNR